MSTLRMILLGVLLWTHLASGAVAGMPAVLPSSWTAKNEMPNSGSSVLPTSAPYLQGISFFAAVLLLSAWAVKGLWNFLCRDFGWLPWRAGTCLRLPHWQRSW